MQLSNYQHPFDPHPEIIQQEFPVGKTLLWYMQESSLEPANYIVTCNGGIVPQKEWEYMIPQDGDDIIIRPVVYGGGTGKQLLSILVMAAVVVASFYVGPAGLALQGVWAALAVGGIAAAGAAIQVFALGPPKTSRTDTPTYSWNGQQTLAQQGSVIPVPKGIYTNAGNVIASYVESINDKQYLNALISFGMGPAKSVRTVKINGNPIEYYSNATYDIRLGKNYQPVFSEFSTLVNTISVDQHALAGPGGHPIIINGERNDTETAEFEFYYPNGIWAGPNSDQSYDSWAVMLSIEYQKVGDPAWTTYIVPGVTNPVGSVPYWIAVVKDFRYDNGREVVIDEETDPTRHFQGQTFQIGVLADPIDTNNVTRPPVTIQVTGTWKKNSNYGSAGTSNEYATGTSYQTIATWSTVACSFESNQGPVPKRYVFRMALPSKGQYNYRITKLGSNQHAGMPARLYSDDNKLFETYSRRGEATWLFAIREISDQAFSYPNHILMSLRVCATDQLSGGNLQISAIVEMDNAETQGYVHAVRWDQPDSYYRFQETGGNIATDLMGVSPGTFSSSAGALGYSKPSLIQNSPDTSIQFNAGFGVTFISNNTAPAMGVDLLLRPSALGGCIIAFSIINLNITNQGFLLVNDGTQTVTGSHPILVDKNCHIALVIDGQTITVLKDGVVDMQFASTATVAGQANFFEGYSGYADEIAIYTTYLPQLGRLRKHYLDSISDHNILETYPANIQPCINLDIITNTLYGGGMKSGLIDVPFYKAWADRCIQNVPDGAGGAIQRYEYNGIIDSLQTLWDTITTMSHAAGASMLRTGFLYSGVLDAPSNPKRLINVSQVIKGSFQETWTDVDDRANSIDVIYYDELDFYKKKVLTVERTQAINAGAKRIKASQVDLRGCTNIARAWHYGNFILKSSAALSRSVQLSQTIDSLSTWPGEVVLIQHDLPNWGAGGKLLSGNTTTVLNLDIDVFFDTNATYTILVSFKLYPLLTGVGVTAIRGNYVYFNGPLNDLENAARFVCGTNDYEIKNCGPSWIELNRVDDLFTGNVGAVYAQNYLVTRTVGSYDATQRKVTLTGSFAIAPDEFDPWNYGSTSVGVPVPFHVASISRQKDLTATINFLEYQDSVYTDDNPQISPAPIVNDLSATVTGVLGNELFSPTGAEPIYAVSWQWGISTAGALVYTSRNNGPEILYVDAKQARSVNINTHTGDTLLIRVIGYDSDGKTAPYGSSPTVSNIIKGTTQNPQNILNFTISSWHLTTPASMTLTWNALPENNNVMYYLSWFSQITPNPTQADCDATLIAVFPVSGGPSITLTGNSYHGVGTYALRVLNDKGFYNLTPSIIRAYSLDDVQLGAINRTRRPTTGLMQVSPPQPYVATGLADGTARIIFNPFLMNTGVESINVLLTNFEVDGLTQGQSYYFFYDDPYFVGGAVTIHATQNVNDLTAISAEGGRFTINSLPVVMPYGAANPGTGGGPPDPGASTVTSISRPTQWSSGIVTPTTPEAAYDANGTTAAYTNYSVTYSSPPGYNPNTVGTPDPGDGGTTIQFVRTSILRYLGFQAITGPFTTLKLVIQAAFDYTSDQPSLNAFIDLSLDNAQTWISIYSGTADTRSDIQTFTYNLDHTVSYNFANIIVRFTPSTSHDDDNIYYRMWDIFEIFIQGQS